MFEIPRFARDDNAQSIIHEEINKLHQTLTELWLSIEQKNRREKTEIKINPDNL